jgi:hypothetical protein
MACRIVAVARKDHMARNKLGPIPPDHFENEPTFPAKNVSPLSKYWIDRIEEIQERKTVYDPYMPIHVINKQTRVLQAVLNTLKSKISLQAKLNWIEVITSESMKELAPEIEAIKSNAMATADNGTSNYRPGDVVTGY